jgi:hypothetical protein
VTDQTVIDPDVQFRALLPTEVCSHKRAIRLVQAMRTQLSYTSARCYTLAR